MDGPVVLRDTWLELPGRGELWRSSVRRDRTLGLEQWNAGGSFGDWRPGPEAQLPRCWTVQALADLACTFAGKMELRMIASHARESELALHEAERRFRAIADSSAVP